VPEIARLAPKAGGELGIAEHAGAQVVQVGEPRARNGHVLFTDVPVQISGPDEVLRHAAARFRRERELEASVELVILARPVEERDSHGIVPTDALTGSMQPPETHAAGGNGVATRPLKERGRLADVARNPVARGVKRPEVSASGRLPGIARLAEERGRPRNISSHAGSFLIRHAQGRTAVHRTALASLLEEPDGACRVAFAEKALLEHRAEARAALTDAGSTRAVEERGGAAFVPQDVFPAPEAPCERVAGWRTPGLARLAQGRGLRVAAVTPGEGGGREQNQEKGAQARSVREVDRW
jgi:hypothetical protein